MKRVIATLTLLFAFCLPAWSAEPLTIDVRTAEEFAQGHIEGALLMPHDQIANLIGTAKISKDTPIAVYCRSGRRSELAKQTLEDLGYTSVVNAGAYEELAAKQPKDCSVGSC